MGLVAVWVWGGLFVSCWSVFLLASVSVFLLSAFASRGGILSLLVVGGLGFLARFRFRAFAVLVSLLGVFVVSVRSSVVSSVLRGSVLLLPGFAWSPAGGRVGSRSRRWVPVWSPALLPSPRPVAPSAPVAVSSVASGASASSSGSLLFLSSSPFVSAVSSGRCPVAVSLSVFSRWPLRSAVLGSLLRVLSSSRVRSFVVSPACLPAARSFVRAGLASLGFSVSGRFLSRRSLALSRLGALRAGLVSGRVPSFFVVGVSSRALVSAFSALARCLWWLGRRSSRAVFCPPALRGLVWALCWLLLPLV